jgi:hypothetical protein
MPVARWAVLVGVAFFTAFLVTVQGEAGALGADVQALVSRPSYAAAWQALGGADYEEFMAFCRARIPPSGSVLSIVAQPAFGYYRGNYDLYPRMVWPYVSPQDPHPNDPHPLPARLLRSELRSTGARYLAVWHVALPLPLPAYRWVATFAPGEYVVALR